jgi:hypothetical protein
MITALESLLVFVSQYLNVELQAMFVLNLFLVVVVMHSAVNSTLMPNMIHLCMLAEEQLFCFNRAGCDAHDRDALDVLSSAMLAFVEAIDASGDKYYRNVDLASSAR